MKRYQHFLWAFLLFFIPFSGMAQQTKAEQKAASEKQFAENRKAFAQLIENHQFVMEANSLYNSRGFSTYFLNSSINFIKVKGDDMIIQIGFDGAVGWNGVGGITLKGHIMHYKVQNKEGKGPISVVIMMSSMTAGQSTVVLSVFDDGMARATITGNFGTRLTLSGDFMGLDDSRVFEGMPNY